MAKRDLIKYYKELTAQYKDMLETFDDIQAQAAEEPLPEAVLTELTQQVEIMKTNCDRLGYAVYLLQKPLFTFKKQKYDDTDILTYFKNLKADKLSVFTENSIALATIKSYVKDNSNMSQLDRLDDNLAKAFKLDSQPSVDLDIVEVMEDDKDDR